MEQYTFFQSRKKPILHKGKAEGTAPCPPLPMGEAVKKGSAHLKSSMVAVTEHAYFGYIETFDFGLG